MNEKTQEFADALRNADSRIEEFPPAGLFLGEMICFLCGAETLGLPLIPSGWRCIEIEGEKKYFFCKKCLPSQVATAATWQGFYTRAIRKIWKTDFNRPLKSLVIFLDTKSQTVALEELAGDRTPSGSLQTAATAISFETIPEMLKNMYEQLLPTIEAAVEHIPESGGKEEFKVTADLNPKETEWRAALHIDFVSFGGVSKAHLPPEYLKKAETLLPLYQTLENLVDNGIKIALEEMQRQENAGNEESFEVTNDNLTFIGDFLYTLKIKIGSLMENNVPAFIAPANPQLN